MIKRVPSVAEQSPKAYPTQTESEFKMERKQELVRVRSRQIPFPFYVNKRCLSMNAIERAGLGFVGFEFQFLWQVFVHDVG